MTPAKGMPFVDEIVNHLFADIWARPGLSLRDRRQQPQLLATLE
jgi:hypothetical protein